MYFAVDGYTCECGHPAKPKYFSCHVSHANWISLKHLLGLVSPMDNFIVSSNLINLWDAFLLAVTRGQRLESKGNIRLPFNTWQISIVIFLCRFKKNIFCEMQGVEKQIEFTSVPVWTTLRILKYDYITVSYLLGWKNIKWLSRWRFYLMITIL